MSEQKQSLLDRIKQITNRGRFLKFIAEDCFAHPASLKEMFEVQTPSGSKHLAEKAAGDAAVQKAERE